MKHNFPNSYINFIYKNKFIFPHFKYMIWGIAVLCCMMIIPVTAYAESEADTVQIEHEQYILERTGEVLVKIFGDIGLDIYDIPTISLTHTSPNGELLTHNVMMNEQGYYEFYFVHDWKSIQGNYDIVVMTNGTPIGTVTYELIQDPEYKTDEEVKEEYYIEEEDSVTALTIADHKTEFMIEANAVEGSKTITITGQSKSISIPVTIMVLAPNGNIVSIDQISPDANGSITSIINVGGPMWKQDGIYTIIGQQGSGLLNKSTAEVEIVDGAVIPEFGTIVSTVFVIAISSIVILSAKSKLRFQTV